MLIVLRILLYRCREKQQEKNLGRHVHFIQFGNLSFVHTITAHLAHNDWISLLGRISSKTRGSLNTYTSNFQYASLKNDLGLKTIYCSIAIRKKKHSCK
jgi:hypothetical protein